MGDDKNFDRSTLESALSALGQRVSVQGKQERRPGDVDAVFEGNRDFIKKLAAEMAEEFGWDENWLNDGVKGWLSNRDADPDVKALFKTYPTVLQPKTRLGLEEIFSNLGMDRPPPSSDPI